MLIDWFTVAAQAVNFLVLAWLLKRFLYKPVLNAIAQREHTVAAQLEEAAKETDDARRERAALAQQTEQLGKERARLLAEASQAAEAERQKLLGSARDEAAALREALGMAAAKEREQLERELAVRTQDEVVAIARKALSDLADVELEDRMVAVFLSRLHGLGDAERQQWANSPGDPADQPIVRSAFALSLEQRTAVAAGVGQLLGNDAAVQFQVEPSLLSGLELTVRGRKIDWNLPNYLAGLQDRMAAFIHERYEQPART